MEKLFIYDLETTGVFPAKHGIHQISGGIRIDGKMEEIFNWKVQPNPRAQVEEEALKVCNVTREQIQAYPPMHQIYSKLIDLLSGYVDRFNKRDKFHLVGYNNAGFDNPFFRGFFKQNNDKYFGSWFWSDTIDVMCLASNYLRDRRSEMPNFQQATVARFLGIEVDDSKLHDAAYDTELLLKIFDIVNSSKPI